MAEPAVGWQRRALVGLAAGAVAVYGLVVMEFGSTLAVVLLLTALPAAMPRLRAFRIAAVVVAALLLLMSTLLAVAFGPGFLPAAFPLLIAAVPLGDRRMPGTVLALIGVPLLIAATATTYRGYVQVQNCYVAVSSTGDDLRTAAGPAATELTDISGRSTGRAYRITYREDLSRAAQDALAQRLRAVSPRVRHCGTGWDER